VAYKVKVNVGGQGEDGGSNKWIDMVVEGQTVYLVRAQLEFQILPQSNYMRPPTARPLR
jgi:hypothetical protein